VCSLTVATTGERSTPEVSDTVKIITTPTQPMVVLPTGNQIPTFELANLLAPAAYGSHYRQSFTCTKARNVDDFKTRCVRCDAEAVLRELGHGHWVRED
jgi:hypothetical protein